jgi:hypothetical protein
MIAFTNIVRLASRAWRFHSFLTAATCLSVLLVVPPLVGMVVDPKVIAGVNAWIKPLKFAIASIVYAGSFLFLLTFVDGRRRLVRVLGTVSGFVVVFETVLITMQVARGTTSHFNASTSFDAAVFSAMGGAITVLALMNLVLGIVLLVQRLPNRVLASGVRSGLLLSFAGMVVAFLMTVPTEVQLEAQRAGADIHALGAHSVGVPDGGEGLPFLGWSTEGGDLRAPHFVGIHGMQILLFLGWLFALPWARWRFTETQRVGFVRVGAIAYAAWFLLLTWQALRGQSVVSPDALTSLAYAALLLTTLIAIVWVASSRRGRGLAKLGLERDELFTYREPVVAQQIERLILDALPQPVGAVVGRDPSGRQTRMPLAPVFVRREVHEAVADQRADVAAHGGGVAADRVGEVAKGHAARNAESRENRPLRAPDARLSKGLVIGGRQRAAGAAHARPDAAHRGHHVDVVGFDHSMYMHPSSGMARNVELIRPQNIDEAASEARCKCK